MVEGMLLVDKFIDQAVVIADQRKYVSALLVPEFRVLEEWAKDNGIAFENREDLCDNICVQRCTRSASTRFNNDWRLTNRLRRSPCWLIISQWSQENLPTH